MSEKIEMGLKIWSIDNYLFQESSDLFSQGAIDFLEIYTVPKTLANSEKYFKFLQLPIILHAPHQKNNFNIANNYIKENNMNILHETFEFADKLDARYIIVHPGYNGDIENSINFLRELKDKRIIIENLPKFDLNDCLHIGHTIDEIKKLLNVSSGFCLDFSHSIKAAKSLNLDHKEFVKEFLELNPKMFHLCDGHIENERDEHLGLGEGNFDMKFLKESIKENDSKLVTVEVKRQNPNSLKEDMKSVEFFKAI